MNIWLKQMVIHCQYPNKHSPVSHVSPSQTKETRSRTWHLTNNTKEKGTDPYSTRTPQMICTPDSLSPCQTLQFGLLWTKINQYTFQLSTLGLGTHGQEMAYQKSGF